MQDYVEVTRLKRMGFQFSIDDFDPEIIDGFILISAEIAKLEEKERKEQERKAKRRR